LPIRLFFRPSNIADAAISIFESPLPPPPPKRIQDIRGAERSANSIDLLADFPEYLPRRKWSLLPSRSLYIPIATRSTCPLPTIRWQLVDTSRFMIRSSHPVSSFVRALRARSTNFLPPLRISRKKFYGATTEDAVMRTWVASMDRFDVHVDAGNSPLLPSTATRYRSRYASSGLPSRISSIYRFSIASLSRDPFCYIYYRSRCYLFRSRLGFFTFLLFSFFFLFIDLSFRGSSFTLVALRRS